MNTNYYHQPDPETPSHMSASDDAEHQAVQHTPNPQPASTVSQGTQHVGPTTLSLGTATTLGQNTQPTLNWVSPLSPDQTSLVSNPNASIMVQEPENPQPMDLSSFPAKKLTCLS